MPVWLSAADHAWLRALIEDFLRLEGHSHREVMSFLQEAPRILSPGGKRQMAIWTFLSMCKRRAPPIDASTLRDALARAAQAARDAGQYERSQVIAAGARNLGLSPSEAVGLLFSDLPAERQLILPNPVPDPHSLAARTNLALAQGLLRLASEVRIGIYGGARAVVRQVQLKRLLCTVRHGTPDEVRLDISGAFSLFCHTTMYGHALASILPLLPWCERFELVALCRIRGQTVSVHLGSGDPIALGTPPRLYDSRLEERFARDFARASLDWDLVREPEPIEAGDALVFPDFAVIHRRDPSKRFLLEIVGFWTPDYLRNKLDRLRGITSAPLVLCINQALNCGAGDLPEHAHVVWFKKRIEPRAVLQAIEAATRTAGCEQGSTGV